MSHEVMQPPKAQPGDRIAVLSPSFAAAGAFPAVHEHEITDPVESEDVGLDWGDPRATARHGPPTGRTWGGCPAPVRPSRSPAALRWRPRSREPYRMG